MLLTLLALNYAYSASISGSNIPSNQERWQNLNLTKRSPTTIPFNFKTNCGTLTVNKCKEFIQSLEKVGLLIAKQLDISKTINAEVRFTHLKDKCQIGYDPFYMMKCVKQEQTLANSVPVNWAARKDGGALLLFPQGLLKQYIEMPADSIDLLIDFNINADWHLSNKIASSQNDFECNNY